MSTVLGSHNPSHDELGIYFTAIVILPQHYNTQPERLALRFLCLAAMGYLTITIRRIAEKLRVWS